ncbi:RabGAP/TBC [Rhizoclosmatium globosum]|uniref:RabGAP/TBC n=1 Tax=Rhizoclosmatium globosum TaxID=329046 RepID=A0A1Y2D133_9FUNG|nr:RabGAP/TBC [Rhizoclosmatium globosum]|eukprot:ORY52972.1 RabGAP/TBC [Rhizoclosmatium globosum]
MASEIRQILDAETLVDLEKLKQLGRYGVPDEVRADTWKYLLGIETADKANEITSRAQNTSRYQSTASQTSNDTLKRIRGEVSRYITKCRSQRLQFASKDPSGVLENVISTYLTERRNVEYAPQMVYLAGPFAFLMASEADVYYGFMSLMRMWEDGEEGVTVSARVSEFCVLVRTLLPELHNHFEEEEVDFKECANSWFSSLLAKELPLECLLRLWDTYFSIPNGLDMHVYVCLAMLSTLKDNLEELEQSEIHGVLLRLPNIDMDNVINQAFVIRDEVLAKRLSEIDTYN